MKCLHCGSNQVAVKDSRAAGATRIVAGRTRQLTPRCVEKRWGKNFIYRKRQCLTCDHKWGTVEISITRNGHRARSIKC